MKKAEILRHWTDLNENQEIKPRPVPYKHQGSTYAEDGIRITGSMEFIDSILSNLKELLEFENPLTRLQLNYQESKDRESGESLGSWNCYIQVHERGSDAKMANLLASSIAKKEVILSRGY